MKIKFFFLLFLSFQSLQPIKIELPSIPDFKKGFLLSKLATPMFWYMSYQQSQLECNPTEQVVITGIGLILTAQMLNNTLKQKVGFLLGSLQSKGMFNAFNYVRSFI